MTALAKPTTIFSWATGGTRVAATSGKQALGFVKKERPAGQILNGLLGTSGDWVTFLDAFFTAGGTAAGTMRLQALLEATTAPTAAFADWQSNPRQVIDHLGYLSGAVSNWVEDWRAAATPASWTITPTGTGAGSIVQPQPGFGQRALKLHNVTSGDSVAAHNEYMAQFESSSVLVAEYNVTAGGSGTAPTELDLGFQFSNSGANNFFVRFHFDIGSSANWFCKVAGGSTTSTDSGVAFAGGLTRLRIELAGLTMTSGGTTAFARFYINGALVATMSLGSGSGFDVARHSAVATMTGTAGAINDWYIGRVRTNWNDLQVGALI